MTDLPLDRINPQTGHEGQTGRTELAHCTNCDTDVHFAVEGGRIICPHCHMVEDATGLCLKVDWS